MSRSVKQRSSPLTEAERRVLPLVVDGLLYREIAERLSVSRRTVETHVASIFRKVGVRSRRDLARVYRLSTGYGRDRPIDAAPHAPRCSGCGRPTGGLVDTWQGAVTAGMG